MIVLRSDDPDRLPEKGEILTKLEFAAEYAKPGDTVLFYFAGHGMTWGGEGYLLPFDANLATDDTIRSYCLPVRKVSEILSRSRASWALVFLDACRNQPSASRSIDDNPLTNDFSRSVRFGPVERRGKGGKTRPSMAFIHSCQVGQRSYDWPTKERGFFGVALEELLTGKSGARLDLGAIKGYLDARVPELVACERGVKYTQKPWVDDSGWTDSSWFISVKKVAATGGRFRDRTEPSKRYTPPKPKTRFVDNVDGTVTDMQTGLMWAKRDNGENIDWDDAKRYCDGLTLAGYSDWQLPTPDELAGLYDESFDVTAKCCPTCSWKLHINPIFDLTCRCPWSSETFSSSSAWCFGFNDGNKHWRERGHASRYLRALAVRSRR